MRASTYEQTVRDQVAKFRAAVSARQAEVSRLASAKMALQQRIADSIQTVASVQIAAPNPSGQLALMLERRAADEQLAVRTLRAHEEALKDAGLRLDAAHGKLDEQKRTLDSLLQGVPEYLDAMAALTAAKASFDDVSPGLIAVVAEATDKLPAFSANPYYAYLKSVNYGTSEHKGWWLPRALDRVLANSGLCNFSQNRSAEQMLVAMKGEADKRLAELQHKLELKRAAVAAVVSTAAEKTEIPAITAQIDDITRRMQDAESAIDEVNHQLQAFASMTDRHAVAITEHLTQCFGKASPDELIAIAEKTATTDDDEAVALIINCRNELAALARDEAEVSALLAAAERDHTKAKRLESELLASNFTSSSYRYNDSLDVGALFTGYLLGRLSHSDVVSTVRSERHEVYDHSPSPFSSGGSFGSSSSSTSFSSSSGFGGGGHSTTGGF